MKTKQEQNAIKYQIAKIAKFQKELAHMNAQLKLTLETLKGLI